MFREAAEAGRSLIFTFAPEATVAPDFPERARSAVEAAGGELIFVRLAVSNEEQEHRIAAPDRAAFGKLRSLELLRKLREQFATCEAAMPTPALTIDTDRTDPAAAARLITQRFGLAPA